MREKSDNSMKAAELLIQSGDQYLQSSVHCSYYATFQFCKFILHDHYKISYEKQNTESKCKDSHNYILQSIESKIAIIGRYYLLDFNNYIQHVKKLRRKADYQLDIITIEDAKIAMDKANKAINLLKKITE